VKDYKLSQQFEEAIEKRPLRSEDTGSIEATQWARGMLEKCRTQHEDAPCCSSAKTALPTRVLDLGEPLRSKDTQMNTPETPKISLYVTKGEKTDYLCLSHCWGSSINEQPLETTEETYAVFQKGIEWSLLPQTFQDAVTFTRRPGLRYLWIDSLCVIQGSKEDWMREAGKMAEVYTNATLVLAAASSSNSHQGLFRQYRTTTKLGPEDSTRKGQLMIRELPEPSTSRYGVADTEPDVLPLLRRAWVFQERFLARRTLFFTPLELVWECWRMMDSESGHPWIDQYAKRNMAPATSGTGVVVWGNDGADYPWEKWQAVVVAYSNLQLTHQSDVLPAIAGLARIFARHFQCEYLAGLWHSTLLNDLCWTRDVAQSSFSVSYAGRPLLGHIPTWSWASLSGQPVVFYGEEDTAGHEADSLCDMVEATCESSIGDHFIQVDEGRVVISGYLIAFTVGTLCRVVSRHGDVLLPCDSSVYEELEACPDYDWSKPPLGRPRIAKGERIFAIPIRFWGSLGTRQDEGGVDALVVSPVQSGTHRAQGGTFVRIGIATLRISNFRSCQYIFEGGGSLLRALEGLIETVQYALQPGENSYANEQYRKVERQAKLLLPPYMSDIYERKDSDRKDGFFQWNAQDVKELERQLDTERVRVEEWYMRDRRGQEQVHKRITVVIV